MNLQDLTRQERFYHGVGEAISTNNMRCFINSETLEVELHPGEYDYMVTGEEDTAQEALDNPNKYIPIDPVTSRQAFRVMTDFVETVEDGYMRQRLVKALNARKPFAHFNHLVHTTNIRELWFNFKNSAYIEIAKEWIEENLSEELKEKIKTL